MNTKRSFTLPTSALLLGAWTAFAPAQTGAAQDFRKLKPNATEKRPFNLPKMETFKLSNGIEAYLISKKTLPTVTLNIEFQGGSAHDTTDRKLLSSACMDLLDEGTQTKDKVAFEEAQADLGITIGAATSSENKSVSLASLSGDLDPAFALFAEMITKPGFREADLDRIQKEYLEDIQQDRASAEAVADRISDAVINGSDHPFGRITLEEDVKKLKAAWCSEFHKKALRPQGARLFVVGDTTKAKIVELFNKHLAGWNGTAPTYAALSKPAPMNGKVFFVDVPQSAQSVIYFQELAPERQSKKFYGMTLMSRVLGGGFASRINMNLREDKGYAYGAYGTISYTKNFGYFLAGSSVRSDATGQSVDEIQNEIKGLKSGEKPVSEAELQREKDSMILGMPANFATSQQALGMYKNLLHFGLPLDTYDRMIGEVEKINLDQVNSLAREELRLDSMRIIVVGDSKSLMIKREGEKDVPVMVNQKQQTLMEKLKSLVAKPEDLVILDADARRLVSKT